MVTVAATRTPIDVGTHISFERKRVFKSANNLARPTTNWWIFWDRNNKTIKMNDGFRIGQRQLRRFEPFKCQTDWSNLNLWTLLLLTPNQPKILRCERKLPQIERFFWTDTFHWEKKENRNAQMKIWLLTTESWMRKWQMCHVFYYIR